MLTRYLFRTYRNHASGLPHSSDPDRPVRHFTFDGKLPEHRRPFRCLHSNLYRYALGAGWYRHSGFQLYFEAPRYLLTRARSLSHGMFTLNILVCSTMRRSIPEGAWDSHMHVIDTEKYPVPKNAKRPHSATMHQALMNAARLSLPNIVFVQVSTYGNDNTWVLDALREVGPARGRGVVALDPDRIAPPTLQQWHDRGLPVFEIVMSLSANGIVGPANGVSNWEPLGLAYCVLFPGDL
ncbi:hypothetical protein F4780DRAFT_720835 [Xylariomycetidae sp. FL0641]|nr:hypothetical protein F4780DRAFT_720835 [Xylariomycetidae sp. FL0641]